MGKFANTFTLIDASWQILKRDKQLILFPLISCTALALLLVSFIPLIFWEGDIADWHAIKQQASSLTAIEYMLLFVFYYCNYFIVTFFNAALVYCVFAHLRGETMGFKYGLRSAAREWARISEWALIAATVGFTLRIIEDRVPSIAATIVAMIGGMAFSIVSFFVIPIMVIENRDPLTAMKESGALFRKTWGERAIAGFGLGMRCALFLLIGIIVFIIGAILSYPLLMILAVFYLGAIIVAFSALQSIFQTTLYFYATTGVIPTGFDVEDIQNAFDKKK